MIFQWMDNFFSRIWECHCIDWTSTYLSDYVEEALQALGAEKPLKATDSAWSNFRRNTHVSEAARVNEDTLQFYQCTLAAVTLGNRTLQQIPTCTYGCLIITYNYLIYGSDFQRGLPTYRVPLDRCKRVCLVDPVNGQETSLRAAELKCEMPCLLKVEFIHGGFWLLSNFSDILVATKFLQAVLRLRRDTFAKCPLTWWRVCFSWCWQACWQACMRTRTIIEENKITSVDEQKTLLRRE